MNTCRCTRNHGNFSFFMELVSSFSVLRLPRYKHKNSCYMSVPSVCLGKKRNYITEISLVDRGEYITDLRTSDNPSRGSSPVDNLLKYKSETHPFLQASGLQHWFKNWQKLRKNKLTASTFPAAVGFWPRRRVQLWLEKIGAIEPFSGNLATCWSNIKEEEALERYKLITGNTVVFPEFQVYNTNPVDDWLAASPDGVVDRIVYELPSHGVLEIKCPFFGGDMSKASPWSRIPLYYIPQAQGLMEILGKDWMDFYVWTPKGSSLFRLYRDEEYWDAMKWALSDFWWKHVQPAKELYNSNVIINPLSELSSLKPDPRHELCGYLVYESKRIVDNSKLLMREIHGKLEQNKVAAIDDTEYWVKPISDSSLRCLVYKQSMSVTIYGGLELVDYKKLSHFYSLTNLFHPSYSKFKILLLNFSQLDIKEFVRTQLGNKWFGVQLEETRVPVKVFAT